jgi:hypothetical protein
VPSPSAYLVKSVIQERLNKSTDVSTHDGADGCFVDIVSRISSMRIWRAVSSPCWCAIVMVVSPVWDGGICPTSTLYRQAVGPERSGMDNLPLWLDRESAANHSGDVWGPIGDIPPVGYSRSQNTFGLSNGSNGCDSGFCLTPSLPPSNSTMSFLKSPLSPPKLPRCTPRHVGRQSLPLFFVVHNNAIATRQKHRRYSTLKSTPRPLPPTPTRANLALDSKPSNLVEHAL